MYDTMELKRLLARAKASLFASFATCRSKTGNNNNPKKLEFYRRVCFRTARILGKVFGEDVACRVRDGIVSRLIQYQL